MLSEALTTPAQQIAERLVARGESVAVAESSAGGLISASLLSVAGASRYYHGGVVFYNLPGLDAALGDATDLDPGKRGACEHLARFLCQATRAKYNATWGVSETGATGPDPNPYGDPAGHAWVGVAGPDGLVEAENVLTGDSDRVANMEQFAAAALRKLAAALA